MGTKNSQSSAFLAVSVYRLPITDYYLLIPAYRFSGLRSPDSGLRETVYSPKNKSSFILRIRSRA